jgi:uncharacterized protein (UPF0335 family)
MHTREAAERLRAYIERAETLMTEIGLLKDDLKEVFSEAKTVGFNPKIMKVMIKERAVDPAERLAWHEICDQYRAALGMLEGTPLGEAALERFEGLRRASKASRPKQHA